MKNLKVLGFFLYLSSLKRSFYCIMLLILMLFFDIKVVWSQTMAYDINSIVERTNDIIPPSPNAAALGEYVTQPVGYYTGIPHISIPIWNLQLKDFNLPISLDYHAGGITVEETASNVGLGWSLKAGGLITRTVRDIPDDEKSTNCNNTWYLVSGIDNNPPLVDGYSYCANGLLWAKGVQSNNHFNGLGSYDVNLNGYNGGYGTSTSSLNLLKKFYGVTKNQSGLFQDIFLLPVIDKEPDIFYFNFANYSGKFVFDVSGSTPQIRTIPYQDLKIEYATNSNKISEFTITDPNGIKYIFNTIENTEAHVNGNVDNISGDGPLGVDLEVKYYEPPSTVKNFTSSWYLSRVETPLGEWLDFEYVDETYRVDSRGPQNTTLGNNGGLSSPGWSIDYDPNVISSTEAVHGPSRGYYNAYSENYVIIFGKRLSRIFNDEKQVVFGAGHERQDVDQIDPEKKAYAITAIVADTRIGGTQRIKSFLLDYDYFESPIENINPGGDFGSYFGGSVFFNFLDQTVNNTNALFNRLRLKSITEYGNNLESELPPYKFEYKDKDFTGVGWHSLPYRLSFQQDYWGYYNAASGNKTLIPKLWVYPTHFSSKDSRQFSLYPRISYTGSQYTLKGAERRPNLNTFDMGLLTKIIYPTGGFTNFEYSSHQFSYNGEERIGGGARIDRIIKHHGEGLQINYAEDIIIDYQYTQSINNFNTSGVVIAPPIFAQRDKNIYGLNWPNDNGEIAYNLWTTRYSEPQGPLTQTSGSYIGYRNVLEYMSGAGYTERKYSLPASWYIANDLEIPTGLCDPSIDGHCDGFYNATQPVNIFVPWYYNTNNNTTNQELIASNYDFSQFPTAINTFPFPENPNYDWQRGHLLSEIQYNESGDKVMERTINYKNYFPNGGNAPKMIYGYRFSHHYPELNSGVINGSNDGTTDPKAYAFRAAKYEILVDVVKVKDTETITNYSPAPGLIPNTRLITYNYLNNIFPGITERIEQNSNNEIIKIVSEYSTDLTGTVLGSDVLRDNHMHSIPMRQVRYNGANIIGKTDIIYGEFNSMPNIERVSIFPTGGTENEEFVYDYDSKGNIIEKVQEIEESGGVITVSGKYTSFIWGYDEELPVIKAENVKYSDLVGQLSQTDINTLKGSPTTSQVLAIRNSIAASLPGSLIAAFSYDPRYGVISETDPSGITTYYEYDNNGRLSLIKDKDGNQINEFVYNYIEPVVPATRIIDIQSNGNSISTYSFGTIQQYGGTTQTVQIKNIGNADLYVTNATLSGPDVSNFAAGIIGGSQVIAPGNTADLSISFYDPALPLGNKSATITISSDKTSGNNILNISGTIQ